MDTAKVDTPILAGIIPIKSVKMAQYMNDRIPGVNIPAAMIQRIAEAGDDKGKVVDISVEIAATTIRELKGICKGVHIMAIGWEDKIPTILQVAL